MSNEDTDQDATPEQTRRQQALRAKLRQDQDLADVKWLMDSPRGRRFLWRLLQRAGIFRTSFTPNAMQMALAEGRKQEGLELLARIHTVSPDLYPVMVKENTSV